MLLGRKCLVVQTREVAWVWWRQETLPRLTLALLKGKALVFQMHSVESVRKMFIKIL